MSSLAKITVNDCTTRSNIPFVQDTLAAALRLELYASALSVIHVYIYLPRSASVHCEDHT